MNERIELREWICNNIKIDEQRGQGVGVDGPKQFDGGADFCVCPSCGYKTVHTKGVPCKEITCSNCGASMGGKNVKEDIENIDEVPISARMLRPLKGKYVSRLSKRAHKLAILSKKAKRLRKSIM